MTCTRFCRVFFAAFFAIAVAAVASIVPTLQAQGQAQARPDVVLKAAIDKEVVDGDLKAAIEMYRELADGADRAVAAQALVRMGQCFEKLGAAQAAEARKAYERVVAQFGDQGTAAQQAKARLVVLGVGSGSSATGMPGETGPRSRMLWSKTNWDSAKLSPDATKVAFIDEATSSLMVRDIDTGVDHDLTKTPKERAWKEFPIEFAWSHDGTRIAYDWYIDKPPTSEVRVVSVATGEIKTFERTKKPSSASVGSDFLSPSDWSPDGERILVTLGYSSRNCRLGWLRTSDGAVTEMPRLTTDGTIDYAIVSPDGRFIAYAIRAGKQRTDRDIYIATSDGTSPVLLVGGTGSDYPVAWTPDGAGLLYRGSRSGVEGLWLLPMARGAAAGTPSAIQGVGRLKPEGMSRTGALLYETGNAVNDLWMADIDFGAGTMGTPRRLETPVGATPTSVGSFSPDGSMLVYRVSWGNRWALVVADASGDAPRVFTLPFSADGFGPGSWTDDSTAFFVDGAPEPFMRTFFRVDAKTGDSQALYPPQSADRRSPGDTLSFHIGVSGDGKTAYYQKMNPGTRLSSLWSRDVARGTETLLYQTEKPAGIYPGRLSPDGARLPFSVNTFGPGSPLQVMVLSIPDRTVRQVATAERTAFPEWSRDGRYVVVPQVKPNERGETATELRLVDVATGQTRVINGLPALFLPMSGLALHPDGKHVVFITRTPANTQHWLLENFLPPAKPVGTTAKAPATPKK